MNRARIAAAFAAGIAVAVLAQALVIPALAAALPEEDRVAVWAEYQRESSNERKALSLTKADLRAAVNGLDDYMEANKTAINTSIPQPARGALTAKQKARLLVFVIERRWKVEP